MIRSFTFDRFYVIGRGSAMQFSMNGILQPRYMAEKHGNLEHLIDTFKSQYQWNVAFVRAVEPFSADATFDVSGLEITSQIEHSSWSNHFSLSPLPLPPQEHPLGLSRRIGRGQGGSTALSVQSKDLPNFRAGWLDKRTGHAGCTRTLAVVPRACGSWDGSKRRWIGAFAWLLFILLLLQLARVTLLELIVKR
jgi:hypothetical protein